jgi:hypothetical protein
VKISLRSPKTEFGAQNQYGRVIHPSFGNFTWSKKKYTFGQKGEKGPEPKNRIWGPILVWSCNISIVEILHGVRKNILLGAPKWNLEPKKIKNKFPRLKDKNK